MKQATAFVLVVAFLLAACDKVLPTEEIGSIEFSLTEFAPWVVTNKSSVGPKVVSSDAWMHCTEVLLDLYKGTTVISSATWTPSSPGAPGIDPNIGTCLWSDVPVDTGYHLVVKIINEVVSTTNHTVEGESSTFDVTAGNTTNVSIICFPVSPVTLTDNVWSSTYTLDLYAEKWFIINTPYTDTRFVCESVTGDMDIYIFKPDGTYLGKSVSTTSPEDVVLSTPSNPYYLAMYGFAAGSGRVGWLTSSTVGSIAITIGKNLVFP